MMFEAYSQHARTIMHELADHLALSLPSAAAHDQPHINTVYNRGSTKVKLYFVRLQRGYGVYFWLLVRIEEIKSYESFT